MLRSQTIANSLGLTRTSVNFHAARLPLDVVGLNRSKKRGFSFADALLICLVDRLVKAGIDMRAACSIAGQLKDELRVLLLDQDANRFVAILRQPDPRGRFDFTVTAHAAEIADMLDDPAVLIVNMRAAMADATRRLRAADAGVKADA